jgi:hypothetical protein
VHKHCGVRARHDHKWLITAQLLPLQSHGGSWSRSSNTLVAAGVTIASCKAITSARARLLAYTPSILAAALPLGANCICSSEASGRARRDAICSTGVGSVVLFAKRSSARFFSFSLSLSIFHFELGRRLDTETPPTDQPAGWHSTPPVVWVWAHRIMCEVCQLPT